MNSTSDKLLTAMNIIANKNQEKYKYDITIQATIDSLVNLDTGEYKVKYNGNTFSAFSNDLTYTYKDGTNVYVKVPEGDFSNKKFIENKVQDKSLSEEEMNQLENTYCEIEPSLDKFFNYSTTDSFGVIAYDLTPCIIYKEEYINNNTFIQYAKNYEYLQISADFLSLLYDNFTTGNYGLELEFYANDTEEDKMSTVIYRLDFSSFNGNPYHYTNYSTQSCIFKIQKNFLLGLKSIKLFNESFPHYDRYIANGEYIYLYDIDNNTYNVIIKNNKFYYIKDNQEILITNPTAANPYIKENKSENNIFVKNIKINFLEGKNLIDNLYYLRIKTPQGTLFTGDINNITLEGQLIYNNNSILNSKNSQCQWFELDYSVLAGDERYNKEVGYRWKEIENNNFNLFYINKNSLKCQKTMKLLVTYNDTVKIAEQVTVKRDDCGYNDCRLIQSTQGDDIFLSLDSEELKGYWYYSLPDNSYSQIDTNNEPVNSINIKQFMIYSSVVFYCQVVDEEDNVLLQLEHSMLSIESEEDLSISYDGEYSFRYDANGDITIEDSEKERLLQCNLIWKEGYGSSYKLEWLLGDELIENTSNTSRYKPTDSQIDSIWIDKYKILHYNIKQKYRRNYNNNTLTVRITTVDNKVFEFQKEIIFVKDGDQGTNGTTYILTIRPCDNSGNKISGFYPLKYYNNKWQNEIKLKAYIYKDGELINDGNDYGLSYNWVGINAGINERDKNNDVIFIENGSLDKGTCVKAQVNITEKNNSGKQIQLYAFYPLDVIVGNQIQEELVNIDNIPSYIKYTATGTNPSFYSNALTFEYENEDKSNLNYVKSLNTDVLDLRQSSSTNELFLSPASKFYVENDNYLGILKLTPNLDSSDSYILHTILLYLDTYGNEAINGWDGTKLEIDDNGKYIYAPQVGAGEKDANNKFTGVTMGLYNVDENNSQVGLYGFDKGINTFGLRADGTAYFGPLGKGRIQINGNSATIYGGQSEGAANSMVLRLYDKLDDNGLGTISNSSTKAIEIKNNSGGRAFDVDYTGALFANNVNVKGTVTADTLYADGSGTIAGWIINNDTLSKTNGTAKIELNSTKCSLTCNQGTIGGWIIDGNTIHDSSNKITLDSSANTITSKSGSIIADYFKIKVGSTEYGEIGMYSGQTDFLGIKTSNNINMKLVGNNITYDSSGFHAFWCGNGGNEGNPKVQMTKDSIIFKYLPSEQFGIYAKFA